MTAARAPRRRRSAAGAQSRLPVAPPDLDALIAAAERDAIVTWRGERIPFRQVPARVAALSNRDARNRLFTAYHEAVEAINPLREARLSAWHARLATADRVPVVPVADEIGFDPAALRMDLQRFMTHAETPYFAAQRRHLALIDIEQGDATLADLWHLQQGSAWNQWFDDLRVATAARATVAAAPGVDPAPATTAADGTRSWHTAAERLRLTGAAVAGLATREAPDPVVAAAIGALYGELLADASWLGTELGMARGEIAAFADFVAFNRLWRLQRDLALLTYELRLHATPDPALRRAYYAGIVGTMTGFVVPEAAYLAAVHPAFASAERLRAEILGAMMADGLAGGRGGAWWREARATGTLRRVARASNVDDALAILGYDALDWRPVLRQIRTQLIGEMSGYGGPNITTRAGTRKV